MKNVLTHMDVANTRSIFQPDTVAEEIGLLSKRHHATILGHYETFVYAAEDGEDFRHNRKTYVMESRLIRPLPSPALLKIMDRVNASY